MNRVRISSINRTGGVKKNSTSVTRGFFLNLGFKCLSPAWICKKQGRAQKEGKKKGDSKSVFCSTREKEGNNQIELLTWDALSSNLRTILTGGNMGTRVVRRRNRKTDQRHSCHWQFLLLDTHLKKRHFNGHEHAKEKKMK